MSPPGKDSVDPDTELAAAMARTPVNALLGLRLLERDAESARVALPLRPDFVQEAGRLHGGLVATLADTAAVYVLAPELPEDRSMTSIEFKLNFLRPADVSEGAPDLVAHAKLVKRGRTVGLCEVEVRQAERELATGLFTYMFLDVPTVASDPGAGGIES